MSRERPNVVFILSDDQGVWAAGCYDNPEIQTPNIDRLAHQGMLFESFFCATPVCSPSRATFLTGRIPSQHGVHDWIREGNLGDDAYLAGEVCYTDIMAQHGYTCGISGKWHLGAGQLPQHGFQHWYVHQAGSGPYYDAPMIRGGELVTEPGYITDRITDDALSFIDAHAADAAPFYLSLHYTAPHSPWECHPQEIVDSYDDCPFVSCPQEPRHPWSNGNRDHCLGDREMLKGYFAAVTAMDLNIGRVLDRLESLGIRDDTIIVFASDNGFSCGQHGFWGKGNGTVPLNMYEESIKVPFLVSHPHRIPERAVYKGLASSYDWMPTLLDYLGLPVPDGGDLVGRSFAAALRGDADPGQEEVVIYDEYGSVRMVRTRGWKLVRRYPDGPDELYDLVNDPSERNNRVLDPTQVARIRELESRLETWFAAHVDPVADGIDLGVTGFGQMRRVMPEYDDGRAPFAPVVPQREPRRSFRTEVVPRVPPRE